MKFLSKILPQKLFVCGRRIFMAEKSDNDLACIEALDNPLDFKLRHIRELEGIRSELSNVERRKFNQTVEYYLSLLTHEGVDNTMPSKVIFEVYNSPLYGMVGGYLKSRIQHYVDDKRQYFVNAAESKFNLEQKSQAEIIKITRLYSAMEKRAGSYNDESLRKALGKISAKLILRAKKLLSGYQIVGGKIESLSGSNNAMKTDDKFWILEVYRLFPRKNDWLEGARSGRRRLTDEEQKEKDEELEEELGEEELLDLHQHAKATAQSVVEEMLDLLKDGKANSVSMVLFWETMDQWANNDEEISSALDISPPERDKINKMIERGNTVQFVAWADLWLKSGNAVLLPSHLKALDEIIQEDYDFEAINMQESDRELKEERDRNRDTEEIININHEINAIDEKIEKLQEKTPEEILSGNLLKGSSDALKLETTLDEANASLDRERDSYMVPSKSKVLVDFQEDLKDWRETSKVALAFDDECSNPTNDFEKDLIEIDCKYLGKEIDFSRENLVNRATHKDLYEEKTDDVGVITYEVSADKQDEYYDALQKAARDELGKYQKSSTKVLEKYRARLKKETSVGGSGDKTIILDLEEKILALEEGNQALQELVSQFQSKYIKREDNARNNRSQAEDSIKKTVGFNEKEKKEKLIKKRHELREKVDMPSEDVATLRKRTEFFQNPQASANKVLQDYNEGLNKRAEAGNLFAADYAVLFDDEPYSDVLLKEVTLLGSDPNINPFHTEFQESIEHFRNDFDQVMDVVFRESFSVDPSMVSDKDRFAQWSRKLDEVLSASNLLPKLQELEDSGLDRLTDLYKQNGKTFNVGELLEGAVVGNRDKIMDLVKSNHSKFGFNSAGDPKLEEFLGQYHRFHSRLTLSDAYKELQEERHNMTLSAQEIGRRGQEVNGEVNALFSNADWAQIWQFIVPYLEVDESDIRNSVIEHSIREGLQVYYKGSGRWKGDKSAIRALIVPYLAETVQIDSSLLDDIVSKVLDLGLQERGKEEILVAAEQCHDILVGGLGSDLPGKELIKEAQIQSMPVLAAIKEQTDNFEKRLVQLQHLSRGDIEKIELPLRSLLLEGREVLCPKIKSEIDSVRGILEHVMPDKSTFINAYVEGIELEVENLSSFFDIYHSDILEDTDPQKLFQIFDRFPVLFRNIHDSFDIFKSKDGKWKDHIDLVEKIQNEIPETTQFLKDTLGIYGEDAAVTARKKYEEMRDQYKVSLDHFNNQFFEFKRAIHRDSKLYNDEEFRQFHGTDKATIISKIHEVDADNDIFNQHWNNYAKDSFFPDWLDRYNNPETRLSALSDFGEDWKLIGAHVDNCQNYGDKFFTWSKEYAQGKEAMKKSYGFSIRWVSVGAMIDLWKEITSSIERTVERKRERDKYEMGQALFGKNNMLGLGDEFRRRANEAEDKRVGEFKETYKPYTEWEMRDELQSIEGNSTNDKDKVRAIMDLLNDEFGSLRWDDPMIWDALNRLNTKNVGEYLDPDIMKLADPAEKRKKIRSACNKIWDNSVFKAWDESIEQKHDSAVKSVAKEFQELESHGDRERVFSDMLDAWSRGEPDENVSSAKYEGFLFKLFEDAKMNGTPDKRWFYLIMGISLKNPKTGGTLLSRSILDRFDESLLGVVPYFDFFTDSSSLKKDGWIVPKGHGGTERSWNDQDFETWGRYFGSDGRFGFHASSNDKISERCSDFFYNNMLRADRTRDRLDKNNKGISSNADHDDAPMWFAGMSFDAMTQALQQSSQGTDLVSPVFGASLIKGFDPYMRATYEEVMRMDQLFGVDDPGWREKRDMILKMTGQRLRVAYGALQTVSGNVHLSQATGPVTIDKMMWDSDSNDINTSKIQVEGMMRELLIDNNQDISMFDEVSKYRGTRDTDVNYKARQASDRYKKIDMYNREILGGGGDDTDVGLQDMYDDTDAIWNVLKSYGDKNGGISTTSRSMIHLQSESEAFPPGLVSGF